MNKKEYSILKKGDYLICKKEYIMFGNNGIDYLYYVGKKYIIDTKYTDGSISILSDHKINHTLQTMDFSFDKNDIMCDYISEYFCTHEELRQLKLNSL